MCFAASIHFLEERHILQNYHYSLTLNSYSIYCPVADDFCQDVNLSDIEILKNDLLIIEKTRLEIQTNAKKGLIEALNNESESQVK